MSFPQFDPNQGQANQFSEPSNGNGATPQPQQQPQPMQQQMPMLQQQQGIPQQGGPGPEGQAAFQPFQGQGGMEHGSVGSTPGGDSKTTLW
jgi:hypothetical protein